MMKIYNQIVNYLFVMIGSSLFIYSCVNKISEDEEVIPTAGDIPVMISAKSLHKQIYQENCKDAIGVYILISPGALNEKRYAENICFSCTASGFISDKEAYYPAEKGKCDIISYYPYQKAGILSNEYNIHIAINPDQSTTSNYNLSDFMTAEVRNVTPSKSNVDLPHAHRLCQLSIIISPTEETDIKALKDSNPLVIINDVPTHAIYNFKNQEFTSLANNNNIQPNGTWSIHNGTLIGKKCILIPQTIAANTDFISLQINNKSYSCHLTENYQLESGTACEIKLLYDSQKGLSCITPQINDWKQGSKSEVTPEEKEEKTNILINDFNFDKSNVYNIIHQGKIVAEVCKEYLCGNGLNAQALVVYPVKDKVSDLSNGTVLRIFGTDKNIHGGRINWKKTTNSFTYQTGDQPPISVFYIASDLSIALLSPAEPLLLSTREKMLSDSRGAEVNLYPIIKIGTQYWMRENLKTIMYNNGKKIAQKTETNYSKTTAGYFKHDNDIFYNKAAVTSGELAPLGWKIADENTWQQLKMYINKDASALKAGNKSWENSECETNNLSGFSAFPVGIFTKDATKDLSKYGFAKQFTAYWNMGDNPKELAPYGILLRFDSNEIKSAAYSDYCAYSIRCVQ